MGFDPYSVGFDLKRIKQLRKQAEQNYLKLNKRRKK